MDALTNLCFCMRKCECVCLLVFVSSFFFHLYISIRIVTRNTTISNIRHRLSSNTIKTIHVQFENRSIWWIAWINDIFRDNYTYIEKDVGEMILKAIFNWHFIYIYVHTILLTDFSLFHVTISQHYNAFVRWICVCMAYVFVCLWTDRTKPNEMNVETSRKVYM